MANVTISGTDRVGEVLEQHPAAAALFEQHGVDPLESCGVVRRFLPLNDTPETCHLTDLDGLLAELNALLKSAGES